ncbi:hypothetical protein AUK40_04235 [Candidatus Wirthbacteria bacterium CG2_30_54_11]|uniref:Uncharacterized protein n=1 Tax=Candidatus Wirthbacteria bacterium CG2_30_54_11 TaxID=1817892 RepID=A0A1J5IIS8_9BACT|nr:MAG: hypothetical protein AUK40_04235 [Candidatus Wirthbacteria bacterium CG2_30_54_11]
MPTATKKGNSYALIIILLVIIFGYSHWYRFCFNLFFIGYNWLGDMRLATVFFAVFLRLVLLPFRFGNRHFEHKIKEAEAREATLSQVSDPVIRKARQRELLQRFKPAINFMWFDFCFFAMNAYVIHKLFVTHFTPDIVLPRLYHFVQIPDFPLITTSFIPLVGRVIDLTKRSQILDVYASCGAAITGLFEIVLHKKYTKRDLLLYLVLYPGVAFNMNWFVRGGFTWTLICFEVLTVVMIILEKVWEVVSSRLKASRAESGSLKGYL